MTPKVRQSAYYLSSALLYILGLVQVWYSVKTGGAIADTITGLGTMLGGTAPGYAGYKTGSQIKDGTFNSVPVVDQVINGVQAVVKQQTDAAQAKLDADATVDKVKDAVVSALAAAPVLGELAQKTLNSL